MIMAEMYTDKKKPGEGANTKPVDEPDNPFKRRESSGLATSDGSFGAKIPVKVVVEKVYEAQGPKPQGPETTAGKIGIEALMAVQDLFNDPNVREKIKDADKFWLLNDRIAGVA